MQRATGRLKLVWPLTLAFMFLLLYFNFRNVAAPLVVILSIPFALVGGIWLQYAFGFNMSVAVAVGYIALAGVSAEIGVLVLTFIDQEVLRVHKTSGKPLGVDEILLAAQRGTAERVRPIVMKIGRAHV